MDDADTDALNPITSDRAEVEIESVCLERRNHCLIRDLSLSVASGETLAVMGSSGAGKTTLLHTIAGLAAPTSGRIKRRGQRVAMVFQDPRLLPWKTALENIELVVPKERSSEASHWLDRVGLGEAANVYPGSLSGGMRQRVAIARALAFDSSLLLVDEPFSNLDDNTAQQLRTDLLNHVAETEHGVIWVTHNPDEARAVSSRTLVINGPPEGSWEISEREPPNQSTTNEPTTNQRNGK